MDIEKIIAYSIMAMIIVFTGFSFYAYSNHYILDAIFLMLASIHLLLLLGLNIGR